LILRLAPSKETRMEDSLGEEGVDREHRTSNQRSGWEGGYKLKIRFKSDK